MVRDPDQLVNLAVVPGHTAQLKWLHDRTADEVERLGGRLDFLHERIAGTGRDDTFFVSPNIEAAVGGDGDDTYLALSPGRDRRKAGRRLRHPEAVRARRWRSGRARRCRSSSS